MTDLSGLTPAEQVRALGLAAGDTIEFSHKVTGKLVHFKFTLTALPATFVYLAKWDDAPKWDPHGEWPDFDLAKFTAAPLTVFKTSQPDPAEPLRRELMTAHALLKTCYDPYHDSWQECVDEWLARNAAFVAGEAGGE